MEKIVHIVKKMNKILKNIYKPAEAAYLYFRLCYNTAGGHTDLILSLVKDIGLFILVLDSGFIKSIIVIPPWFAIPFGIFSLFFISLMGHSILKTGIRDREVELANKYNPDLQKLLERTKK